MSNTVNVTKEITFDCAHMLSGHESLCKNLHGHTYKVQITVSGTLITEGSSKGMVIDFKHLKRAIQEIIVNQFDHATIISAPGYRNEAEEELLKWLQKHNMRHFIMPTRTTAENMAGYFESAIINHLTEELGLDNIDFVTARVYETPTSFAEV